MEDKILRPNYSNSHALIIGINQYKFGSSLDYAVNDALAVATILKDKFDFQSKNIKILCDKKATHDAILENFLSFSKTETNDRLLVFYAGHGYTITSRRGEVGYLVPFDGDITKLDSLIRWDELTRNADIIEAKHILFIMDACYGGLAITRTLQPGSTRFIKDMYKRYSRQVITAGKANETVADSGGPLPNHSIFTGHFLEALSGKASIDEGFITANSVMAYVYRKVANDVYSRQTPHFGYLDGDGDFIFSSPKEKNYSNEKTEDDRLITIPSVFSDENLGVNMTLANRLKGYLSETSIDIRIRDLVVQTTRELISLSSLDNFSVEGKNPNEVFNLRLKKYEEVSCDALTIEALLSYWGDEKNDFIVMPIKGILNSINQNDGVTTFLRQRWYPVLLLLYTSGIASMANNKYNNLYNLLHIRFIDPSTGSNFYLKTLFSEMININSYFKKIPDYEQKFVPINEYIFKFLQPIIDDQLFLGSDYETAFDNFEILLALEYAHINKKLYDFYYAPIGRFGWKYWGNRNNNPFVNFAKKGFDEKENWPYIKAGFFDGSFENFSNASGNIASNVESLHWF